MQPNDIEFEQYLRDALTELTGPLKEALPAVAPDLDAALKHLPNFGLLFFDDFWTIFLYIAAVDHHIKGSEAAVFQDVCHALDMTFDHKLITERQALRQLSGAITAPSPDDPDSVKTVIFPTLNALGFYDSLNGTSYLEKARAMFFRFAEAIVKADVKVTGKEETSLSVIKDILWQSSAGKR